jgi:hypothetical protein
MKVSGRQRGSRRGTTPGPRCPHDRPVPGPVNLGPCVTVHAAHEIARGRASGCRAASTGERGSQVRAMWSRAQRRLWPPAANANHHLRFLILAGSETLQAVGHLPRASRTDNRPVTRRPPDCRSGGGWPPDGGRGFRSPSAIRPCRSRSPRSRGSPAGRPSARRSCLRRRTGRCRFPHSRGRPARSGGSGPRRGRHLRGCA